MSLSKEEEILMNIADIIGYVYITESVLLRAEKLLHTGSAKADYAKDMAKIYLYGAIDKVSAAGKEALYSFGEGDELNMMLVGLRRFTKAQPFNVKDARQRIAKKLIDENKYCF